MNERLKEAVKKHQKWLSEQPKRVVYDEDYDASDPLAPSKGMMVGLMFGAIIWGFLIGGFVWLMH